MYHDYTLEWYLHLITCAHSALRAGNDSDSDSDSGDDKVMGVSRTSSFKMGGGVGGGGGNAVASPARKAALAAEDSDEEEKESVAAVSAETCETGGVGGPEESLDGKMNGQEGEAMEERMTLYIASSEQKALFGGASIEHSCWLFSSIEFRVHTRFLRPFSLPVGCCPLDIYTRCFSTHS